MPSPTNNPFQSKAAFIAHIIKLDRQGDASEKELLDAVIKGESYKDLWVGYRKYEEFVADTFPSRAKRFRVWQSVRTKLTAKEIDRIGVDAAIEVTRIDDAKKRKQAIHEMFKAVTDQKGAVVGSLRARKIVSEYRTVKPRNLSSKDEIARLQEENDRLKKRVTTLEAENQVLHDLLTESKGASSGKRRSAA